MKNRSKVRFVHDVETGAEEYTARKPFKVERENKRRFVRLEIASPMTLNKIKDMAGSFWPEGEWHTIHGVILNVSAGGVLVEADQVLLSGDILSMHFTMQDVEKLDGVIGIVKRVHQDKSVFLTGIEFVTRESLADVFTQAELDLLPEDLKDFNESVQQLLNRYIAREKPVGNRA
jgi:hypothetical protein